MRSLFCLPVVTLLLAAPALALPAPGEQVPNLETTDLNGATKPIDQRLGEQRTLVVAITDRDAAKQLEAWMEASRQRGLGQARGLGIVSLDMPFYVSDGMVRSRAKEQVPSRFWDDVVAESNGALAEKLGLPEGETPTVMVLGPGGKLITSVQAGVDSPEAKKIWDALRL